MKLEFWQHCYDDSWKGLITNDAFAHPAKMARGLVRRIFDELFAMGALRKGDTVLDPFGGVGTTGIESASRGVQAYLVELEDRFVRFAKGYDCPGLSKSEWVRWLGRLSRNKNICPTCQGKAGDWYRRDSGIIPESVAHRYRGNFELNETGWAITNKPRPIMLQGDSRKLREVLVKAFVDCLVSSPPYAESQVAKSSSGVNLEKQFETYLASGGGASFESFCATQKKHSGEYGSTDGQLSQMPQGKIDSVLSSPPYNLPMSQDHNGSRGGERGITPSEKGAFVKYGSTAGQLEGMPMGDVDAVVSSPPFLATEGGCNPRMGGTIDEAMMKRHNATANERYGDTNGQLGNMKQGSVAAVVSSPPYSESIKTFAQGSGIDYSKIVNGGTSRTAGREAIATGYGNSTGQLGAMPAGQVDSIVSSPPYEGSSGTPPLGNVKKDDWGKMGCCIIKRRGLDATYGNTDGQIGHTIGETFWSAARDIVLECHALLKPGGVAVWVVKDFVRNKKRVRFSDDWIKLCEACGFKLIRHAHAMLVKETRTTDLFGEETVKRIERKSFFRRLYEQNLAAEDERRIDHEDVVFFVKD